MNWCRDCYDKLGVTDGTMGFSLRHAGERPHDVHVDLSPVWNDSDAVIATVSEALRRAGLDNRDFLAAAPAAVDDDDELLTTCNAWVHVTAPTGFEP